MMRNSRLDEPEELLEPLPGIDRYHLFIKGGVVSFRKSGSQFWRD